jgi:hypothetical protein
MIRSIAELADGADAPCEEAILAVPPRCCGAHTLLCHRPTMAPRSLVARSIKQA